MAVAVLSLSTLQDSNEMNLRPQMSDRPTFKLSTNPKHQVDSPQRLAEQKVGAVTSRADDFQLRITSSNDNAAAALVNEVIAA